MLYINYAITPPPLFYCPKHSFTHKGLEGIPYEEDLLTSLHVTKMYTNTTIYENVMNVVLNANGVDIMSII
jgi:hypothetical protein